MFALLFVVIFQVPVYLWSLPYCIYYGCLTEGANDVEQVSLGMA
jgi:hypothetical protein